LALAVTRKLVQEHGGRIELQSEVGQGAAFTVTLPSHRAALDLGETKQPRPQARSRLESDR
jgi:signal transduction histidine kinase